MESTGAAPPFPTHVRNSADVDRNVPGEPIRVAALVEAATVTGPAKSLLRFARDNRHLVDIRIFTFLRGPAGPGPANPFLAAAAAAGLTVEAIPEKRRFDFSVLGAIQHRLAAYAPHILQTHSVKSHFLVTLLGRARPRPWVAFHHGYTSEDLKMRAYNTLDRYSLRRSDRMVTVCEAFVPELVRCGVVRGNVDILRDSIDPAWGDPAPSPNEASSLLASLGLAPGILRILAVGRLSREKGHATLIEAVARIRHRRPDLAFEVLLAGDGPLRASLVALAEARGVAGLIRFLGHVSDVRALFGVSGIMVLPSLSEGTPNVLLEAMAIRVPVVATRAGGVPEIVRDRESALLVPPADPEALAGALLELIADPALGRQLAARARDRVAAEFTPALYDARLLAVYGKALASDR